MDALSIFSLIFGMLIGVSQGCIPAENPPASLSCTPFRTVLQEQLTEATAVFFSENPRDGRPPLTPSSIKPMTPHNVFKEYFGEGANPRAFADVVSRILYSDPGPEIKSLSGTRDIEYDRAVLRGRVHAYAKDGSFDLAREKFGVLLYRLVSDFGGESWRKYRCVDDENIEYAEGLIASEIARLRSSVLEVQFGEFLGLTIGSSLAISIDETGSMTEEIEAARRRSLEMMDVRHRTLDQPEHFVLVPFSDPKVGPLTATRNADVFRSAFNRIYAHGGGDLPELSMQGILLAVENSRPGTAIFVFTDAEAKDAELQNKIIAEATRKRIKINFLLTNKMASWLCAGFSSTRRLAACRDPSLKFGYDLYEYLADSTGGKALVVLRNDIFKSTELIDILVRQGLVPLETRTFENRNGTLDIPVDSDIKELFVQASGECDSLVLRKGTRRQPAVESVLIETFYVGRFNMTSFGTYRLSLSAAGGSCTVKVYGKSTKGFVQTLAKKNVTDDSGRECLKVFYHQPLLTESVVVMVDLYGFQAGDRVNTVAFIDEPTGEDVYSFDVTNKASRHFRVNLEPQKAQKVVAYISGVDVSGQGFRRLAETSIAFSNVSLDCSALDSVIVRANAPTQVPILITNNGAEAEYYTVGATDERNYITSVSQARVLVGAGTSSKFYIRLRAPTEARPGDASTITITAKAGNDGALAVKQCRLIVGPETGPEIESFTITSNINSRFAETTIRSRIVNEEWVPQEATFYVMIPPHAFVTEFTMTVGGVKFPGEIMDLNDAHEIYGEAKDKAMTAAIVTAREKSNTVFRTSINLESDEEVVFELKYQELLRRTGGKYRYEANVQTHQPVGKLSIQINIWDTQPLGPINVLNFFTEQTSIPGGVTLEGVEVTQSGSSGSVSYSPTSEQQTRFSPLGMNGRFAVEYDVEWPDVKMSEMVGYNRAFAHFFIPNLPSMRKRVVFLLDNSASMYGRKLEQLKESMSVILRGLHRQDAFAVIFYNNRVQSWDPDPKNDEDSIMVPATRRNIGAATAFINGSIAEGGTDLLKAIEIAINVINGYAEDANLVTHPSTDFIVVLSDSASSQGETSSSAIVSGVDNLNNLKYGIHTIGFGSMADKKTLSRIAARNNGRWTQIFQDIDAHLQISNFFETIANPVIRDIEVGYDDARIFQTTTLVFEDYQQGSEMVVAGEFTDGNGVDSFKGIPATSTNAIQTSLSAKTDKGDVQIEEKVIPLVTCESCTENKEAIQLLVERLRKYMRVLALVRELEGESDKNVIEDLRMRIVNVSIECEFVVPGVTAMVVAKPNDVQEVEEMLIQEPDDLIDEEEVLPTDSPITPSPSAPTTTTRQFYGASTATAAFGSLPFTTVTPYTASRPRLEFFGDPHFVIDIEEQITLCFNWEGKQGQTINLLHDPSNGITVNGRLVTSGSAGDANHPTRTYVNKLGITLAAQKITLMITSKEVKMSVGESDRVFLPFGKYGTKRKKYVTLKMRPVTKFKSTLFIHVRKNLIFRVISRVNSKNKLIKDHLDFSVIKGDGLAPSAVGVLGQFSRYKVNEKVPASIEFRADGKTALLWYRNNPVEVSFHSIKDYNMDRDLECWYMADKKQLWENEEEMFVVKGILEPPESKKLLS